MQRIFNRVRFLKSRSLIRYSRWRDTWKNVQKMEMSCKETGLVYSKFTFFSTSESSGVFFAGNRQNLGVLMHYFLRFRIYIGDGQYNNQNCNAGGLKHIVEILVTVGLV